MPFSHIGRTDTAPKRANESSYRFLDRSARPEIERVRVFLGEAIGRYPADGRDEIVARLQSEDEVHFRSAAFEVLLHEGLRRLGFSLFPHPDPGTGVARRPDFLVIADSGHEFYLEAVLAGERDGRNPAAEAIKRSAIGLLDETPHQYFLLDVQSEGDPTTQPSARVLIREVHAWLDTLDVEALRARLEADGFDQMPSMDWSHEGWELTFRPIPLSDARRGRARRLVAAQGAGVRRVNTWEPLRDAVKKKANRYGELARPLVVAINADGFHLDVIDEVQALYGEEQWVEVLGHPERSGLQRRENGAWRGPNGPQCRRVSGVWFFNDLTPYTLANRRSTLYLNPWAHQPVSEALSRLPTKRLIDDTLVATEGVSLQEIYGIPPEWPE